MRSVHWSAAILALVAVVAQARVPPQEARDPDALYDGRVQLQNALDAAAIWDARQHADPKNFEAAWKLARACYWIGGHTAADARRSQYERGIAAGRRAVTLRPDRPEGHFWIAANMGAMAESFGLVNGIKYRGAIKSELETVLRLDPAYLQGSADRALGRWYQRVPALFGGSNRKSIEHLRQSLTYDPASAASHAFLADTYTAMGRRDEARQEWRLVLDAPDTREWGPEDAEFKAQARAQLAASP